MKDDDKDEEREGEEEEGDPCFAFLSGSGGCGKQMSGGKRLNVLC